MTTARCAGRLVATSVFTFVFALSTIVSPAHAEARTPYRAQLSVVGAYTIKQSSPASIGGRPEREVIPEVRITGQVRGEGNIDARFTTKRNKTWRSFVRVGGRDIEDRIDPVLLQGKLAVGRGWRKFGSRMLPSAAAIIGRDLKLTFPGRIKGRLKNRQRIYTIRISLDGSMSVNAHVASIPAFIVRRGACGANVQEAAASVSGAQQPIAPLTVSRAAATTTQAQVVTLSTDADPEWYAKYGQNSNAVIASLVNTAEALYDRQLGVRFRIVRQHVYTGSSPYVSTDAGYLLSEFVTNSENPTNLGVSAATYHSDVDLSHLFTGKDLDGSVVGIAYIGVLCAAPALSYGLTQSFTDIALPGIFAHEVGHNFGASHDVSDRSSLMYPSISIPPSDHFSDASLAQVRQQMAAYPGCFSTENVSPLPAATPAPDVTAAPTPTDGPNVVATIPVPTAPTAEPIPPTGTQITLLKRRVGDPDRPVVRLFGSVREGDGLGSPWAPVRLVAAGMIIAEGTADAKGNYEFFVRVSVPASQRINAVVETLDGQSQSNLVWLKKTAARATSER